MNTRFDPELSRLAFEDRLIEFCEDVEIPVLERVRLLAIVAGRLDVFFMTRVGRLKRMVARGNTSRSNAGQSPAEQLEVVSIEADRILRRAYQLLNEDLLPKLAHHGVTIDSWDGIGEEDRNYLRHTCAGRLAASIKTVVVEHSAEFPHVRNLRPALVADVRPKDNGKKGTLVIELPDELPRLVRLGRQKRFVPLEQIIVAQLPELRPELDVGETHLFRVTRNADTDYGAEHDVLVHVEREIVRRPFQEVVRLEIDLGMPEALRDRLIAAFQCESETPAQALAVQDAYVVPGLVDLTALEAVGDLELPTLQCEPIKPRARSVDRLLDGGTDGELLHFPYDDYDTSLEHCLSRAARHPDLESLQVTIYRTDKDSGVVKALRVARARGAEVSALVELKASFDERDNIELARTLEADGVRVVLSPASLKVHAKIALVTLRGSGDQRRVAFIGTGNMNGVTAKSYVDLWLVTADPKCTREVATVFDILNGRTQECEFHCLLVAPFDMRRRFVEMIERETENIAAGRPAGIRAMINGLSDPAIISALYRASQAGVPIDLMVRGMNMLRPAAPEISENIRIVSVAGRLLQHARIFHFTNAGDDRYFIGSADWRVRNLDDRVEVVTSVTQSDHQAMLDRILTTTSATRDAWELGEDGVYRRREGAREPAQGSRTYTTLIPS